MVALLLLEFVVVVNVLGYNTRVEDVNREVVMEVRDQGIVALGDGVDNSRVYS